MQSSASKNACRLSLPRFVVSFSSRWVWHGKLFFPYSCFDRGWYGNPWNRAAGWRWQWNLPAPTNKKTRFEYEIRKLSGPKYRAIKSAFQSKLKQGLHAPIPPPPPPPSPLPSPSDYCHYHEHCSSQPPRQRTIYLSRGVTGFRLGQSLLLCPSSPQMWHPDPCGLQRLALIGCL